MGLDQMGLLLLPADLAPSVGQIGSNRVFVISDKVVSDWVKPEWVVSDQVRLVHVKSCHVLTCVD
jgi:hypothetical protein